MSAAQNEEHSRITILNTLAVVSYEITIESLVTLKILHRWLNKPQCQIVAHELAGK